MTEPAAACPPAPPRMTAGELVRVAIVMVAVAAAMNFRLVTQIGSALPSDLGDPLLNTFILAWDADRIRHGFDRIWDAPLYFPRRDTLAYSEHLLGLALFSAPIQWLTGNPVLASNLMHLGSWVLCGVGMYLLARSLWGRADAAWIAGIAFACAPYRVAQLSHLQSLISGWMPIALWGLHEYFRSGSRKALAAFAAAYALLALSNGYYLYFFAVPVVVVVGVELVRMVRARGDDAGGANGRRVGRTLAELTVAALAILATIAPVAAAYLRVRERFGLVRVLGEIEAYSASPMDYLSRPVDLWIWKDLIPWGEAEHELFPGLIVTALAAAGMALAWRSRRDPSAPGRRRRRLILIYGAILVLAVWMSFGPAHIGPYRLLMSVLPGLNGLRVPTRIMTVVTLALAVLASGAAAWMLMRLGPRTARWAAVAVALAIGLEGFGVIRPVKAFDPRQERRAELNAWIRQGPQAGVLELPASDGPEMVAPTMRYQYNTLLHGRPIVNGYSGHRYPLQSFLEEGASPLRELAMIPPMVTGLRRLGVRTLVLHKGDYEWFMNYEPSPVIALLDGDRDQVVESRTFDYNGVRAWRLADIEPLPVFKPEMWTGLSPARLSVSAGPAAEYVERATDGDPGTRWDSTIPQRGDEWVQIGFDRTIDVVGLQLRVPPDALEAYPRHLVVESEREDGSRVEVFSGAVLAQLMQSLVRDPRGVGITLTLPPNRSRALRLRQTGAARHAHWSIAEIAVWERRPAAK